MAPPDAVPAGQALLLVPDGVGRFVIRGRVAALDLREVANLGPGAPGACHPRGIPMLGYLPRVWGTQCRW